MLVLAELQGWKTMLARFFPESYIDFIFFQNPSFAQPLSLDTLVFTLAKMNHICKQKKNILLYSLTN